MGKTFENINIRSDREFKETNEEGYTFEIVKFEFESL